MGGLTLAALLGAVRELHRLLWDSPRKRQRRTLEDITPAASRDP